jgi:hypothetical protein
MSPHFALPSLCACRRFVNEGAVFTVATELLGPLISMAEWLKVDRINGSHPAFDTFIKLAMSGSFHRISQ